MLSKIGDLLLRFLGFILDRRQRVASTVKAQVQRADAAEADALRADVAAEHAKVEAHAEEVSSKPADDVLADFERGGKL